MALRNPRTAAKPAPVPPAPEPAPEPASEPAAAVSGDIPGDLLNAYFNGLMQHFASDPVNLYITKWVRDGYATGDE